MLFGQRKRDLIIGSGIGLCSLLSGALLQKVVFGAFVYFVCFVGYLKNDSLLPQEVTRGEYFQKFAGRCLALSNTY